MPETTPLGALIALPLALAGLSLAAAGLTAVLSAAAAGSPQPLRAASDPLRETARLLVQSRRRTLAADRPLTWIGVVTLPTAAVLAAVVVPMGDVAVADLPIGLVWFNAMEVLAWAAVWLVGWGPNSAYALIGGYRFIAQGIAYELPHMFALIAVGLGAGSLRVGEVVAAQDGLWFGIWMPVAFAVYLISALAMAFWGPFSQPVADDLAGGAATELTGPDRLIFLGGRYGLLVTAAAFAVPLFLGGGAGPLLPAWTWSLLKTAAVLAALVWAGLRLPLVRMDRFTQVSWMVLIPAMLLQLLVVSLVVL